MIVGLGIDVCSVDRMRRAVERTGDRMAMRICSAKERAAMVGTDHVVTLAGRFAVKEAFAKALHGARGVGWHEVEVEREPSGRPVLRLSGNALKRAESFGANAWHVSISHDAGIAAAVVILEKS